MHLEDESGRVRLVGEVIRRERDREGGGLVTGMPADITLQLIYEGTADQIGVVMAALGMETSAGDFEVIDLCFAGLPELVDISTSGASNGVVNGTANGKGKEKASNGTGAADTPEGEKTWVAIVSGLSVGSEEAPADVKTEMLVEWLTGESGGASVSFTFPSVDAWYDDGGTS